QCLSPNSKWKSDCQSFARCKIRSLYQTNSKNDSSNSQRESFDWRADCPRNFKADMLPARSRGVVLLPLQTTQRHVERRVALTSFTRCGLCKRNSMKLLPGFVSWRRVL